MNADLPTLVISSGISIVRKDSFTTRLLLISIAIVATYAAIVHFGF
ncbi:hypothetical protein OAM69_05130 [bacterium]|nr:hypothetical protein [bacterium]